MKKIIYAFIIAVFISSCSDEVVENDVHPSKFITRSETVLRDKEECFSKFAEILSKAVFENEDLRIFLKKEALKQFDNNYDILYYLIKDEKIGNATFRDILVSYSSDDIISQIEYQIPLLNIVIPPIPFFDITVEDLDVSDKELPVAVSADNGMILYLDGKQEGIIEKGNAPAFNVIVINENVRVEVDNNIMTRNASSIKKNIKFKSSVFDGMHNKTRSYTYPNDFVAKPGSQIFGKAIEAYKAGFNSDSGANSKGFQRDYIYYGITPQNHEGQIITGISEYIDYIKVDPTAYYKLSDVNRYGDSGNKEDPIIINPTYTNEKRELTTEELIERMWSKGAYTFRFEVFSSSETAGGVCNICYATVYPKDLWDFNIELVSHSSGSLFSHSKYTYKIDPANFKAKKCLLNNPVNIGSWNIGEEAINRWINIVEEDAGEIMTTTTGMNFSYISSSKLSISWKNMLGTGIDIGGETSSSTTKTKTISITYQRTDKDDDLGMMQLKFYDPIVTNKGTSSRYIMNKHNTGIVTFTLTAR